MQKKFIMSAAAVVLTVAGLAGCAAMGSSSGAAPSVPSRTSNPPNTNRADDLTTARSSLGTILVNGKGMTVYAFDKDTANSGTSACTGSCLDTWPPVTISDSQPLVNGVSGSISTIKDPDGKAQITIDGRPLYTFAGDAAKGDVKGQGLQNVWWVVSPAGTEVKPAAATRGY